MRAAELGDARVGIWGLAREGRAAIRFLRARHPDLPLLLLDDAEHAAPPAEFGNIDYAFGRTAVASALDRVDVLVKSPGVSLYRPEILSARERGVRVTSLLNLWFAEGFDIRTICVTGSKGKSTTASLIAHMLGRLGQHVALAGNIGVPITVIDPRAARYAVIELSSYQVADFDGLCDVAALTSLFPEHLDWHRSLAAYFNDKLNLLRHSRCAIVNAAAMRVIDELALSLPPCVVRFNDKEGVYCRGSEIFDCGRRVGPVGGRYLARPHNLSNLCAALTVVKRLGFDLASALDATDGFRALPHRQQDLGMLDGILYVDDSISTAPDSTIAALEVYAGREITLLVGGYDRGIDYDSLVAKLAAGPVQRVACMGASGSRIHAALRAAGCRCEAMLAESMGDAVAWARENTPRGGVVLLSPAAPSYGAYRDFTERGRDFALKAGFVAPAADDPG